MRKVVAGVDKSALAVVLGAAHALELELEKERGDGAEEVGLEGGGAVEDEVGEEEEEVDAEGDGVSEFEGVGVCHGLFLS